jgi:two-component system OmpR family sensor kinase
MMSIRLRFTLLYSAILAVTLVLLGTVLYSIQAQTTLNTLKSDLLRSSATVGASVVRTIIDPSTAPEGRVQPPRNVAPPVPLERFSSDTVFQALPEREIVRVLDAQGNLVASPFGSRAALPVSTAGMQALQNQQEWWETGDVEGQRMLIYNRPIVSDGAVTYILQVARHLTERDRSLQSLRTVLVVISSSILLAAFGIGWLFSGVTLRPIRQITQTARAIGEERDFSRRVSCTGPQDEVGQLATTFNTMLVRLQEAHQQTAHALDMQRIFLADVSHELRTPLTTLRGNLGLLRRTPPIPADEQSDILNDMVDESDRLIRLVNALLVQARADAARNFTMEELQVRPLLDETCRQAQQIDPKRKISLYAAGDIIVLGDRDALKQIALILLDNALKHSAGDIAVSAGRKDAQVVISVQDHGAGIPPEQLEHIFDRFYRGEDAADGQGFGLGLSIAQSLVEALGGTITMESQVGQGSCAIVRFPVSRAFCG